MRIYGFHPSTDYKCIRRRSCIFLECIHCIFPLQSFTAKQFSLIIDQPRLLGWMLPLLSKFWHKWERLYWIIQRYTPFVIHTVLCMFFFVLFLFIFYQHTDDVNILSSFFLSSKILLILVHFSLMKSWLTRMNSLDVNLYISTLQWQLYRKKIFQ